MSTRLAWIGVGNLGRGMCKNLVAKGNLSQPLILFNRTKQRAEELSGLLPAGKSAVASSITEAVSKSDIIFTCVGDDKALNETIETALQSQVKGKLFVDCSTVHPETTEQLAKAIVEQGAGFVASPVFGAAPIAEAGQLIFVLAGPPAEVEKVKPYTTGVMGRAVIDLSGESQGKASLLKVTGNTFILQMIEALSEGHTLAEKTGLGVDNLHKFVELLFPGPYTAYSERMKGGAYYKKEPLFYVDLARKDAGHALELAESSGCRLRAVEVADEHLAVAQKHTDSKGDIAGIYGAVRMEAGLKYEN
ncbi:6-phosphogluconate dehydrogenase [Xylona heveae TC161]|uniref:6-phosphogluconate dehydrogenase n=1 Tax=Xylona heveae (strain CBS 132557 / TC161) TaxID=1328760 RepID=A0A165IU35_XYLHT|nr:6-phosphogluconate dehydrogenase [Xylona heveae TC161]KZF25393.1 6-phosphogluconate dehydrogenase [Xylona heveae TC161]